MNGRWIEFEIRVNLKKNLGIFGFKRERHQFAFCAQSADDARALACRNVPSRGWPDDELELEIVGAIPVFRERDPFVHPPLKSLRDCESEREEMEFA